MTSLDKPVDTGAEAARRMTRWSWLMLPAFAAAYLVTSYAAVPILTARGQSEGDLFAMTEDVAGVALELGFALLLAVAPVVGVVLAVKALRWHTTGSAWAALTANGLLVLFVVYQFVDALRMSFLAPLD